MKVFNKSVSSALAQAVLMAGSLVYMLGLVNLLIGLKVLLMV
jgi:hypothetical protein